MHPIRLVPFAAAALLAALPSHAATTATQTRSVERATNFTDALAFDRFDATLGTLTGVTYTLTAGLDDVIGLESLDRTAVRVTGTIVSTVTLARPDGTSLAAARPGVTRGFDASAFDGAIDFAGTSGVTFDGMGSFVYAPAVTVADTDAADLSLFSGMGTIQLPVTANAVSSATGSGNAVSEFQTSAQATATVFYTYTPTIAMYEPRSLALLGAGVFGLGLLRRSHASR